MERLLSAMDPKIGAILDRALLEQDITAEEAETLFGVSG